MVATDAGADRNKILRSRFQVLPRQRTSILAASASSVAILKLDASLNHAPGRLLAMARTRVRERSAEVGTFAALKSYEGRGMGWRADGGDGAAGPAIRAATAKDDDDNGHMYHHIEQREVRLLEFLHRLLDRRASVHRPARLDHQHL